jgi:uncharacterized protein
LKTALILLLVILTSFLSKGQDTITRYYRPASIFGYFAHDSTITYPYIKNCSVYPFDYSIKQYNLEKLFEIFPFIEENGKVIPNKQFIAKDTASWLYKRGKSKFDGLNDFNPDDNIVPALDSLPDGKYMQYYAPTYYTDKDTIKKIEKQVACVFHLKNNLIHGESFWFDEIGKLYKKGTYINGKREGEWEYWFVEHERYLKYKRSKPKKDKDKNYVHSKTDNKFTTSYKNGLKHGKEIKIANDVKETLEYELGEKTGAYLFTIQDTIILISGRFNKDEKVGEWFFYDYTPKYLKKKIIGYKYVLTERYTINETKIQLKTPPIRAYLLKQKFGPTAGVIDGYYINGFERVENSTPITDYYSSFYTINQQQDKNDKSYFFNYLEYEKYYPNGQLFTKFKLENGQFPKVNDTIFNKNGTPLNVLLFDSTTCMYEQHYFDRDGKFESKEYFDTLGNQIETFYKTIDNLIYSNIDSDFYYWMYEHKDTIHRNGKDTLILINQKIVGPESKLLSYTTYNPKYRIGKTFNAINPFITTTGVFQFDSNFLTTHYQENVQLGNLNFEFETADSLLNNSWYKYYKPNATDSFIRTAVIDFGDLKDTKGVSILAYKDQSYSGDLIFHFEAEQDTIIYKRNKVHFYISNLNYNLIKFISPNLDNYLPYFITWGNTKESLSNKNRTTIKTISIPFVDGKINGEILFMNYKKEIMCQLDMVNNLLHGKVLMYSTFRDYAFIKAKNNYLLTETNYQNGEKKGLEVYYEPNGDTARFQIYPIPPKNGLIRSEYTNSNHETNYENDLKHGTHQVFDKEDKLRLSCTYYKDTVHGDAYAYKDGKLYQKGHFIKGSLTDSLITYNPNNTLQSVLIYDSNHFKQELIYEDGILKSKLENTSFKEKLGIQYKGDNYTFSIRSLYSKSFNRYKDSSGHYIYFDDYQFHQPTGLYTEYNSEGKTTKSGNLTQGERTGLWKFDLPYQGKYTILYQDSVLKLNDSLSLNTKGIYTNFDSASRVLSVRYILSTQSLYNCGQNETYDLLTFYIIKDSLQTWSDTNFQYYYPNGVLQSEGKNDKGLPEGLWKFYNDNGTLREMGHFKNGLKTGRWLAGDLSKIHYTGDLCLDLDDPEAQSYLSQLKTELEIEEAYFEKGELIRKDVFQVRGK